MMRRFKFRYYEKEEERAVGMKYAEPDITNMEYFFGWAYRNKNLMQFTGLKDKNGKEIYEGDILAAPHTYNIEIIYKNGGFLMEFFDDIGEKCEYHLNKELIEQDDLEIIGNKYENPELLGDVNECSR
jgi:uncharacterized phage protein (TIGR01671 family)